MWTLCLLLSWVAKGAWLAYAWLSSLVIQVLEDSGVLRHGWKQKYEISINFFPLNIRYPNSDRKYISLTLIVTPTLVITWPIKMSLFQKKKGNTLPKYHFFSFRCKVENGMRQNCYHQDPAWETIPYCTSRLWPRTSFWWCALIRQSLFSTKASGFIFSHFPFLMRRIYFVLELLRFCV